MTLTELAKIGFWGNSNPYLYGTSEFYAHAIGAHMHHTGCNPPTEVMMGRKESIWYNGKRYQISQVPGTQLFTRILE